MNLAPDSFSSRRDTITLVVCLILSFGARLAPPAVQNAADGDPKKLKQLARAKKIIDIRIKEAERASNRRKDIEDNLPVGDVNYFTALAYCRWVSEQQGTECGLPTIEHLQR